MCQLPRTTLRRHLKGKLEKLPGLKQLGKSCILGPEKEMELVNCIIEFEKRGLPSSVAGRGGGGGGLEPPHWLVKYAKSHLFGGFEVDF